MLELIALLEKFGYSRNDSPWGLLEDKQYRISEFLDGPEVVLGKGAFGYVGFGCSFKFNNDGKYLGHGAFE